MKNIDKRVENAVRDFQVLTFGDSPSEKGTLAHIMQERKEINEVVATYNLALDVSFLLDTISLITMAASIICLFVDKSILVIMGLIGVIIANILATKVEKTLKLAYEHLGEELADFVILDIQWRTWNKSHPEVDLIREDVNRIATVLKFDLSLEVEKKLIKLWRRNWNKPDPVTGIINHR